jgi:sulfur-carrier protein
MMVRVLLPAHLRALARVEGEVRVELEGPATQRTVLDAVEACYPMLLGTIRDHTTQQRRAFLRYFACERDLSHDAPDTLLPEAVACGKEPLLIIGAVAGGLHVLRAI